MYIKKRSRRKIKGLSAVIIIIMCTVLILIQYERKVLPMAVEMRKNYATTKVNEEIGEAVNEVVENMRVSSADFFTSSMNSDERLNYLSVDTMLINSICAKTATEVSKNLNAMGDEPILIPMGVFTGSSLLSHAGPKMKAYVTPIGEARVDYETKFEAVGINQVNFQVWLNVESDVSITNPLKDNNVTISRKIMLVNTVFNGEVPKAYLDIVKN